MAYWIANRQPTYPNTTLRQIASRKKPQSLRVAGCFAGVGGIELGLRRHGHDAVILSEIEPTAKAVLMSHFPKIRLAGDIREIKRLPQCDLISAGFPCQDLSQCGKTAGVTGAESSLVNEVFRLIDSSKQKPNWVLLENVPFMLCLDSGRAMRLITGALVRRVTAGPTGLSMQGHLAFHSGDYGL